MTSLSHAHARLFSTLALLAPITACGASIKAVYEGDVRFEHCMALDSRPDVKPTIRKACWEEWVKFYTFGQTRDRVEFALLREKQLGGASDFDEGEWNAEPKGASAVPEPTSALAPPPMMMNQDGGASPAPAPAPTSDENETPQEAPLPSADCAAGCEASWSSCKQECKTAACEKACTAKYKQCMRRCF